MTTTTTGPDERQKLLRARDEIIEVLKRHNLIAHVVMCGELGKSEAIMHFEAPWSKLILEHHPEGQMLRIRSKKADYGGDVERQRRDLESTLGALSAMAILTGSAGMQMLEVSSQFDTATGATHTPLERE